MIEDKEPLIETLIPRYIDGLLTPDEAQRVEAWIDQSEENRRIVQQVNALTLAVDATRIRSKLDVEKALNKVKKQRSAVSVWCITFRRLERVAALLFIPLLVGVLCWSLLPTDSTQVCRMMEVKTNPGMTTSLVLPDSTVVYLNSESSLLYPSAFTQGARNVTLKGEAYFKVTPDVNRKFIVHTLHRTSIEVHGTSFNVEAYENESEVSTTLVEGAVSFRYAGAGSAWKRVAMRPGQKVVYDSQTQQTALYQTSCLSEVSWKDGQIVFANTGFKEALRILEKRFNVDFVVKGLHEKEYAFTGTFTTQRLERILDYLKLSSGICWRYLDNGDVKASKTKILLYK